MSIKKAFRLACALALGCSSPFAAAQTPAAATPAVHSLKVTILSTMLADEGVGEWGFAALVEAEGHKILFDTGARPNTVLENARELKIDLSDVQDVVLSHFHDDHSGGLMTLRKELSKINPAAMSRVHVGAGIFLPRLGKDGGNIMVGMKQAFEAIGGFHLFNAPEEKLAWTAAKLEEFQVEQILGAHCTGVESIFRLRALMGLTRRTCLVATIGATFDLQDGIRTGSIAA